MKRILGYLSLAVLFIASIQLSSCGGGNSDSPVEKYIEILDKATAEAENISSLSELANVQSVVSQEEAQALIQNSKDYELTSSDKEKLKKATDKLLKVAFEKSMEFSNLPDNLKEASKSQMEMAIDLANKRIDEAKTLGEISGVK